jgi:hypothetical protein
MSIWQAIERKPVHRRTIRRDTGRAPVLKVKDNQHGEEGFVASRFQRAGSPLPLSTGGEGLVGTDPYSSTRRA